MKRLFGIVAILLAAASLFGLVPQNRSDEGPSHGTGVPGAVGTSGSHDGSAENHRGDVITEIETITGANDGMVLVGRRVDLHVDVQARANDHAFWVGSSDNRLLVVLAKPSNHGIAPVHRGQRATIAGVVRAAPKREQRYTWNLTTEDERELGDRKIYIDADTVSSEGHGTGY